jgi:ABC-type multidrug transport system fused ATPase/permease subunit
MIISDLMKMVGFAFMFYELAIDLIVIVAMPILVFITRIFQRKMQVAFEDVRNQISKHELLVKRELRELNTAVQHREDIELKIQNINDKHKKAWIKRFFITRFSFPLPI